MYHLKMIENKKKKKKKTKKKERERMRNKLMIAQRVALAVDPGHLYDNATDYSCESQRIGTHHITSFIYI